MFLSVVAVGETSSLSRERSATLGSSRDWDSRVAQAETGKGNRAAEKP